MEEEAKRMEKAAEKMQDIMQDNADKLADIQRDYGRKIQDINRDYSDKLADIARKTAERREDADRDYADKIEDINRDSAEKLLEAQEDYRKKEIDREAEFQRRLRELREKFLFDLEDALRERDARQVLRLIRQYQMDKKSLEERRKLDADEAKKNLAQKLQDIEIEKQKKLEAAKREYEEKLAEIKRGEARERREAAIWKQRQLQDARIWYTRQLADQREYLRRKLADLAEAYAKELKMQQQFQSQSATGGTSGQIASPTFAGSQPTNPSQYSIYDIRNPLHPLHHLWAGGFAQGGSIVANRPTLAMFGENGAERVDFTPISKLGSNRRLGDMGGMGANNQLSLRVSISEGLIAEIVDSSLSNVAAHIEHTRRSA